MKLDGLLDFGHFNAPRSTGQTRRRCIQVFRRAHSGKHGARGIAIRQKCARPKEGATGFRHQVEYF
ncbi:hypothetical protein V5F80_01550 [Xanthobacter sp. VTT E-85239]|uniref:hypothetical protein n=1 Tax=Xanthobacter sp. VTT E-85239 TaxID=3119919 RepID=UPI00372BF36C